MNPATTANHIAALTKFLCGLIARHGHLRRLAGPLVVLIWGRVRSIESQIGGLLKRLHEGRLRRYPARRKPRPATTPRRPPTRSALPLKKAWLVVLIPETAASACHLQTLLAGSDIPALLQAAPQLRRALRPLCQMLGVTLPPPLENPARRRSRPRPPAPSPSAAPAAPPPLPIRKPPQGTGPPPVPVRRHNAGARR